MGGKGHLTSAEQRARNLAGQGGNITPSTAVDLVKRQDNMEKRLRFQNYVGVVMALGIIAMAVALGVTVSQSNTSTSSAIAKSGKCLLILISLSPIIIITCMISHQLLTYYHSSFFLSSRHKRW